MTGDTRRSKKKGEMRGDTTSKISRFNKTVVPL